MKILTSPAKLMNIQNTSEFLKPTQPHFIKEAQLINSFLKEKSPRYLAELMEISQKLADENWERNQAWNADPSTEDAAPAMVAFTGEVYRGLDAKSLDKAAVSYLQKNHRILSGLYGLLKPSDKIMPYRLEIGRKFQFENFNNLYEFWREKITDQLNSELKTKDFVLNLASAEYIKAVDRKKLTAPVTDVDFYEFKSGTFKSIVVYTKYARGLLLRHCAETKAKHLNDVKNFTSGGYMIDEHQSTDHKLVFVR